MQKVAPVVAISKPPSPPAEAGDSSPTQNSVIIKPSPPQKRIVNIPADDIRALEARALGEPGNVTKKRGERLSVLNLFLGTGGVIKLDIREIV